MTRHNSVALASGVTLLCAIVAAMLLTASHNEIQSDTHMRRRRARPAARRVPVAFLTAGDNQRVPQRIFADKSRPCVVRGTRVAQWRALRLWPSSDDDDGRLSYLAATPFFAGDNGDNDDNNNNNNNGNNDNGNARRIHGRATSNMDGLVGYYDANMRG
jgi:hypothetical protein